MKKLLIIDDDQLIRETIISMLEGMPLQIKQAGSIQEVFELLSLFTPDLIFLDINLRDIVDGISFSHKLNEFYFEKPPKIIFITGNLGLCDTNCKVSSDDLILKPFVKADLLAKLGT